MSSCYRVAVGAVDRWSYSLADWSTTPRAIAVDEATALLIDNFGKATLAGASTTYFLHAPGAPQVCQNHVPLTYKNVDVQRIQPGGNFNLSSWTGTNVVDYSVSATAGVLSSTQPGGDIY